MAGDDHDAPMESIDDQQVDAGLVGRALAGDRDAVSGLIERYHALIYAYVSHLLDRDPAADDLTQETFLIVMRELPGLRQPERFATWVKSIAWRECRNWVRHQRVRRRAAEEIRRAAWMPEDTGEDRGTDEDPWLVTLEAKIEAMADGKRLVLVLFYLDDLPIERIARFLDIPLGTVKRRLFDARQDLSATMPDSAGMTQAERRRFCQTLLNLLAKHRQSPPSDARPTPGNPS